MPEFTVPKFIEREPKILGPLTFKQTMIMMTGAGICLFLYFTIGQENLFLFILIALAIMGGVSVLTFLRIKGYYPVLTFLRYFLTFLSSAKLFIWGRKFAPPKIQKIEKFEKEKKKESALKLTAKGRLQKLSTQVETKR